MDTASSVREFLFTLLLKVAVASSFAALLARWNTFRRVLFTEQRDPDQNQKLMLTTTPPLNLRGTLRPLGGPSHPLAASSVQGAFLMRLLPRRAVWPSG